MQISSRFTIAVHVLTCISTFEKNLKVTSDFLAGSVNVNPVVIRRILLQLKSAELITVARGSGGASVAKSLDDITLLDVYHAVECVDGELFHFHENPNTACPVGRNIHNVLDSRLMQVQNAMENELKRITLADIVKDSDKYIQAESK